ncbi:MAG: type II toxin-antitoxin system ParD family antitoxin [Pseudomonadota bacterium]
MMRKTISMPDTMSEWITGRIARGQYNNESEYFRDLVRRDQEEEQRKALLIARLDQGDAQHAAGDYIELSSDADVDALFDEMEGENA